MYFKNNFYSDGIDRFVVITVATEENENLSRFRKSCSFYNIPYIVLGLGDDWNSGAAEDGVLLEPGGAQKIHYLRQELKSWPDLKDHIVLFTDSYDVVFCASPKEILSKFRDMRSEIVFSTEKTCWPDESKADEYPTIDSDYKFLNSGGFIGYANKILEIIDTEVPIESDDQLFYTNVFLQNAEEISIPKSKQYPEPEENRWGIQWNETKIGSMSQRFLDSEIVEYLKENYTSDIKILDVGSGDGKWAFALSEHFKNIDGIEAQVNYINSSNLQEIYSKMYHDNIVNFDFDYYDVVIMGDVLHHISKNECTTFLDKVKDKVGEIIITVPFGLKSNEKEDNIHEQIKQENLSPKIMMERYPMFELMNWTTQSTSEDISGSGWFRYRRTKKDSHYISLDYYQKIFQTLNQAINDVEQDDEGRFVNKINGSKPCVIHANGPSWIKKFLKEKSFYMFGDYDGNLGSINLITKTHLPTDKQIYLSVFLHQPLGDINQVFDHIRFLDYPKKNILLHVIYDKEEDLYKIDKFIGKYGGEYKEVIVTKNGVMMDSRKAIIYSAIGKCDFLFMLDSNYVFRNNKSIQLLIEKNLGLLTPMIREEGTEWVNFTGFPEFFHERMKNYESKTVFVVDYITGIIVLNQDVLEKCLTFFEPIEDEEHEDFDWDVLFCKNALIQKQIMYVCNMNFYGSIIN